MSHRGHANQPSRLRRFGAAVAVLGLIFASTIASVSHSIAMPMMASAVQQDGGVQGGHHMASMTHDCESAATVEAPQQQPQGPCDEGCMLCKDCTMTSFMLMASIGIGAVEGYSLYAPAAVQVPASIMPPSPNEPPRV